MSATIPSLEFPDREAGTLAPLMECVRCKNQARLIVEDSLTAGLECAVIAVCLDHALAIAKELGAPLGALLGGELAKRARAI